MRSVGSYRRLPHLWRGPNGYLYIVYSDRGRWIRKSTKTKKVAAAEAALKRFVEDGGATGRPDRRLTLAQAAREWLDDRSSERVALARCTVSEYALTVQRIADSPIGSLQADQIEPRDVRELLKWLGAKRVSVGAQGRIVGHLRMLFRWLMREEVLRSNPAEVVDAPNVARGRRPAVTPEQFARLREAATGDVSTARGEGEAREAQLLIDLLDVLWLSGLRSIEATRLRWPDIDLEARTWRIRSPENKGGDQVLPLHPELVQVLRRRRLETAAELGPFAHDWHVRNAWRRFKGRHEEWAGWSLHSLRHGFVTRVRAAHGDAAASFLARHKSRSMTEHYSHFDASTFRGVMESI